MVPLHKALLVNTFLEILMLMTVQIFRNENTNLKGLTFRNQKLKANQSKVEREGRDRKILEVLLKGEKVI